MQEEAQILEPKPNGQAAHSRLVSPTATLSSGAVDRTRSPHAPEHARGPGEEKSAHGVRGQCSRSMGLNTDLRNFIGKSRFFFPKVG